MKDIFLNDEMSQIKRFKGRYKYELFVHQREFRTLVGTLKFRFPKEGFEGEMEFKKKLLSPSLGYLKMIQASYLLLDQQLQKGVFGDLLQEELNQYFLLGREIIGAELPSDKDEATALLNQAYEAVTDRLTATLS